MSLKFEPPDCEMCLTHCVPVTRCTVQRICLEALLPHHAGQCLAPQVWVICSRIPATTMGQNRPWERDFAQRTCLQSKSIAKNSLCDRKQLQNGPCAIESNCKMVARHPYVRCILNTTYASCRAHSNAMSDLCARAVFRGFQIWRWLHSSFPYTKVETWVFYKFISELIAVFAKNCRQQSRCFQSFQHGTQSRFKA